MPHLLKKYHFLSPSKIKDVFFFRPPQWPVVHRPRVHTGYQESYVRLEGKAGKEEDGYEDNQDKFEEYGEEDDDGGAEYVKK